jgi:hypothetical protein
MKLLTNESWFVVIFDVKFWTVNMKIITRKGSKPNWLGGVVNWRHSSKFHLVFTIFYINRVWMNHLGSKRK